MVEEEDHPGQFMPFTDGYVNWSVVLHGVGQAEGGLPNGLPNVLPKLWHRNLDN